MSTLSPAVHLLFPLVAGETRLVIPLEETVLYAALKPASDRSQRLIVFIHGAASNASRWEEFVDTTALSQRWTLVRFDLRGHGASPARRPGRLENYADDIAAVIGAAGVHGPIVVVGHSLGAAAALVFAKRFPHIVNGLVLIDPLLEGCLTPEALCMRCRAPLLHLMEICGRIAGLCGLSRRLAPCRLRAMDEEARQKIAQGGAALLAFKKSYSSVWNDLKHEHLDVFARDLLEVGRPTASLAELGLPLLVLGADSGTFTNAAAMQRETEEAGGRFELLHCLHWPLTECRPAVEAALIRWAQQF